MDHIHLQRYFPVQIAVDPDTTEAIERLRGDVFTLADRLNRTLVEGQAKNEMLMRLLHLIRDAELAIQLDGVSRVQSPIVMTRQ